MLDDKRTLDAIRSLSDTEVVRDLDGLAEHDRHLKAAIVAHLVVFKERAIHLDMGYSSIVDYCVDRLRCSKDTAYKRAAAVKVAMANGRVIEWLAEGEMTLSGLIALAPHADDGDLVAQARGKSKRQIQHLVAARHPDANWNRFQTRVRPVAEGLSKLEMTVPNGFVELIDQALDIDSHIDPGRNIVELLSRALGVYVARRKRERFAVTDRPRAAPDKPGQNAPGPHNAIRDVQHKTVPAAQVRAAYETAAGRCEYVSPDNRRCSATALLEVDHVVPRALGGGHDQIRIYCDAHNQRAAELELGKARVIAARRRAGLVRDVKAALVELGFSSNVAGSAAQAAARGLGPDAELEALIRDALARAGAAHRTTSSAREPMPTWRYGAADRLNQTVP